jgi:hypothetical protein
MWRVRSRAKLTLRPAAQYECGTAAAVAANQPYQKDHVVIKPGDNPAQVSAHTHMGTYRITMFAAFLPLLWISLVFARSLQPIITKRSLPGLGDFVPKDFVVLRYGEGIPPPTTRGCVDVDGV